MKDLKYSFIVRAKPHIEDFLSVNNRTKDSFFWQEGEDYEEPTFYFSSQLLSKSKDLQEIYSIGTQLISIYEGIYTLLDRHRKIKRYFSLQELIDLDENRIISNSPIYVDPPKIDIDFSPFKGLDVVQTNPIYNLFDRITQNDFLIELFFLLSKQIDYRMLYIIYESVLSYIYENECRDVLTGYRKRLERFRRTANSYEILGAQSRHAKTKTVPPHSPLRIEESTNLIFDIIVQLLEAEFSISLPQYFGLYYLDFEDPDELFGDE